MSQSTEWRCDEHGNIRSVVTSLCGADILNTPLLNRGTAFSQDLRDRFGLNGLLPPHVVTLPQQVERLYTAYCDQPNDLHKHIFLRQLQDRNEVLFYALLQKHIEEMMPIVYTPTVALGCQQFSRLYTKPRGLFLSWPQRHRMRQMLESRPWPDVDVIVVTDGERVLGIGDQGVGSMGIPIGKLAIYSLLGGIHPSRTLPIVLDVGTNNTLLRNDPFYLGWRHERIGQGEYMEFVEDFVSAIEHTLPNVLVQWEDFARRNARPILDRYRDHLCTFNDDIQGTAAVVLGALYSALRSTAQRFADQSIVIVGAGGAGTGIAEYLLEAMVQEGVQKSEGKRQICLVDMHGLVRSDQDDLNAAQLRYAKSPEDITAWPPPRNGLHWSLAEIVEHSRAGILIGVSTQSGLFTREVVETMSRHHPRPILFPLSNPTSCAEGVPADILEWTDGRALVATGAPFPPVQRGDTAIPIAQVNNFYIFPGVGLGVAASKATRVTDRMMLAAARALGEHSSTVADDSNRSHLLPPIESMQKAALSIAAAVARQAIEDGVAPTPSEEVEALVRHRIWKPQYPELIAQDSPAI